MLQTNGLINSQIKCDSKTCLSASKSASASASVRRLTKAVLIASIVFGTIVLTGCFKMDAPDGGGTVNSTSSPAESAMAMVNSLASDSEGMSFSLVENAADEKLAGQITQQMKLNGPSCKASAAKSTCNASNQINVQWSDCTASNGATLSGGWTNTYSNTIACMNAQNSPLGNGETVTRTSNGMAIKGLYGGMIIWSTQPHVAYTGESISGNGLMVSKYGNTRTILISGARRLLQDSQGNVVYDHSLVSQGTLAVSGSRSNGTRSVLGGTVRVYNNTEKYYSDNTFSSVQWKTSGCCYPTDGMITSSFGGTKSGYATLKFKSSCGQATLTDTSGRDSQITLKQCE